MHEKMFNIFSHQRNSAQNYIEIVSHPVRMAIKKTNSKCWQGCGEVMRG
jgi:hypothetical protein